MHNQEPQRFAFFDLDNTIIMTNSGKVLIFRLMRESAISYLTLTKLAVFALFYKMRIISEMGMFRRSLLLIKNLDAEFLSGVIDEIVDNSLMKKIRPSMLDAIRHHQEKGERTIIISASLHPLCEKIRKNLRVDDVISTKYLIADGKVTGESEGNQCYGAEKVSRATKYCEANGGSLSSSYYYADSYSDHFLLGEVKWPICVSPDRKLRKIAKIRGWEIW